MSHSQNSEPQGSAMPHLPSKRLFCGNEHNKQHALPGRPCLSTVLCYPQVPWWSEAVGLTLITDAGHAPGQLFYLSPIIGPSQHSKGDKANQHCMCDKCPQGPFSGPATRRCGPLTNQQAQHFHFRVGDPRISFGKLMDCASETVPTVSTQSMPQGLCSTFV